MGNSLLRQNRWQQNTQETPWNLRNQNHKQRTSRCWDCHIAEECFCLPWKKIHNFKAEQDSQKENKGTTSTPIQDNADQNSLEDLCYTLIDHSVPRRRPSGNSAEGWYENISPETERPRESLRGTETEYSLVHVPSTPRHAPSPEDEYELLVPRVSSHSLQQSCPLRPPSETPSAHLY
ncbi:germinal center-associated signaling and motility protein isoform X2 [Diceros bicornis minor]|uniref:Germinal center-associated signaling and motility protein n=1 Tax=Ceratotherium simum simum TaxID=73337 RepID=A0ABM0HYJ9_CERSS|nr:PREDICTED: germinal center-associated signaling and motility protein [Ceratotherium simum simum]XP_058411760.1 germinal center-associated signaling and motility protein isoform X2 [Diceros bicornis minor]